MKNSIYTIAAILVLIVTNIGCQKNNSNPSSTTTDIGSALESLATETINVDSITSNYSDELIQQMTRASSITNPGNSVNLSAAKSYTSQNTSYLDERNWGRDFTFTLPSSIQVTSGQSGNNWVQLQFKPKNSASMICVYRGSGAFNSTSPGCSVSNGNAYQFDYCIQEDIYLSLSCNENIDNCRSHPNVANLSGLSTVAASEVSLNLVSGDSCAETSVVAQLTNIQQTNPSLSCGDVITDSSQLTGSTLDCRNHSGPGLVIATSNKTVDGSGFKILTGPNVSAGILATGEGLKVRAFEVQGDSAAKDRTVGILMFDSKNGEVLTNIVSYLSIGIDYYGKIQNLSQIRLKNNIVAQIKNFGIRLHVEDGITLNDPEIQENIITEIDQFALRVKTSRFTLRGSHNNQLSNVRQYAYLSHGDLQVDGLDIRGMNLTAQAVFVAEANSLMVQNSNLSTVRNDFGVGLHVYNTQQVYINNVTSSSGDVGIKLAVDRSGINMNVSMQNTNINGQRTAGVMAQTNGEGRFSQLLIQNSNLSDNPAGYSIWQVPGYAGTQPSVQNTRL